MKFLVGLHDSYSSVKSQLLLQTPLPSMGKVFSLLLQEESQRSLTNAAGIPIDCQAMIAEHYHNQNSKSGSNYTTRFAKYKGKTEATCTHCGYPGHIIDKCFQLIGYPPGWKGPRGKRLATMSHTSKNFQRFPTTHHTTALQPHLDTPNIVFSQEQMQNLLTLANSISSSKLNNTATEVSTSDVCYNPLLDKMGMINIHSHLAGGYWNIAHAPTEAKAANNSSILAEQATPAADSPTPEDSQRLAIIS
uniref:CCHC-type domain-containing protein n=1 Tax=Populus alba TaxID=43335 RepID=A0A4U5PLY0_POPAL|nr:hypothetical protein D5086_0000206200 [Populus alba]